MFRSVNIILDARLQYDKSQADISVSNASKASLDHLTCFQDDRGCNGDSSFAAINFFLFWCSVAAETPEGREAAVKLIVPRADGYLSKSGLLEQRLIECEGVEKVQSFCQRRQYLTSQSAEQVQWDGLYQMLRNAVGGILVNVPRHGFALSELSKSEAELDNKLSFPWMTPQPITRKMLAYVDGRDRSTTEPLLRSAKALGTEMLVLDTPGHWLELPDAIHLREHFVPFDMSTGSQRAARSRSTESSTPNMAT